MHTPSMGANRVRRLSGVAKRLPIFFDFFASLRVFAPSRPLPSSTIFNILNLLVSILYGILQMNRSLDSAAANSECQARLGRKPLLNQKGSIKRRQGEPWGLSGDEPGTFLGPLNFHKPIQNNKL